MIWQPSAGYQAPDGEASLLTLDRTSGLGCGQRAIKKLRFKFIYSCLGFSEMLVVLLVRLIK